MADRFFGEWNSKRNIKCIYHFSGNVNDDSGNGYNLSMTSPTYEKSMLEQSAVHGNFATIANNMGFSATTNFTIVHLLRKSSTSSQEIWCVSTLTNRVRYQILASNTTITVQRVREGVAADQFTYSMNICDNAPHMVVLTYNGTTLSLYVDGVFRNSGNFSGNGSSGGSDQVTVGGRSGGSTITGASSEFVITTDVLTAQEVKDLYWLYKMGGKFQ